MDTEAPTGPAPPHFGVRASGVILIVVLTGYILADYLLVYFLDFLRDIEGPFSLRSRSENEIRAMRVAVRSAINPWLMLVLTLSSLKTYFPRLSIKELLEKFGLVGEPSLKFLVGMFAVGTFFNLFFTSILMRFFPPDQFVVPHPANVVNYGPIAAILLLAFSAIVVTPLAEEFLFRGVLYAGVARSWGKVISAIVVSVCFVLVHPDSLRSGYWLTHSLLYTVPVLLILVREISGKLFGSIMVHSGLNFSAVFLG